MSGEEPVRDHATTVTKAIQLVALLSESTEGIGINSLCRSLDTQKPGLLRILRSLTEAGWVIKDPNSARYRIGYQMLTLGSRALLGGQFQEITHGGLRRLATETGETTNLGVLDQWKVVFIDQVESPQSLSLRVRIGSQAPIHCTAIGKVLAAHLHEPASESLLNQAPYERFTAHTLTSAQSLASELQSIRKQGFALDNEEHRDGVVCIGAPIRNYWGEVQAAVSISGPVGHLSDDNLTACITVVKREAQILSQQLGFQPEG